jgi:hypothetical protein
LAFYFIGSLNIRTVPTVCYVISLVAWILELFRQCGILFVQYLEYWNCSDSMLFYFIGSLNIGTIPTVCYFISMHPVRKSSNIQATIEITCHTVGKVQIFKLPYK